MFKVSLIWFAQFIRSELEPLGRIKLKLEKFQPTGNVFRGEIKILRRRKDPDP